MQGQQAQTHTHVWKTVPGASGSLCEWGQCYQEKIWAAQNGRSQQSLCSLPLVVGWNPSGLAVYTFTPDWLEKCVGHMDSWKIQRSFVIQSATVNSERNPFVEENAARQRWNKCYCTLLLDSKYCVLYNNGMFLWNSEVRVPIWLCHQTWRTLKFRSERLFCATTVTKSCILPCLSTTYS